MTNCITDIFDKLNKVSQIDHLNDECFEYEQTDRKRCGSCFYWMKSSLCPKEKHIKGRSHGPSCNAYPCDKFELTEWVKNLKEKRGQALIKRFQELHLKVPDVLIPKDTGCEVCDKLPEKEICLKHQLEQAEHEAMVAMDKVEKLKQELNKEKANELSSSKK